MYKIAICIPTFRRTESLKRLVVSIMNCRVNETMVREACIIIVDNDAFRSAETTVTELNKKNSTVFEIIYYSYPSKGLSNVRNELLRKGFERNPDFLIFVDDDEFVTKDWLNELVVTIESTNGDMVMGPVKSLVRENIPKNISCWFDRADYENNKRLDFIRTGNLIINVKSLLKRNIWFDPRFNKTGGEDSFFGLQMIKKGAIVYWADSAVVYENVPEMRANINWLCRRNYNGANKYIYILKIERRYLDIVKKILVSLLYIVFGTICLVLILFPLKRKFWGLLKIAEGFGGITGFFNLRYEAYN